MRRVAITGVGIVSALGDGLETNLDAFTAGRGGIGPITRFDATGLEARLAAQATILPLDDPEAEILARRDIKIGFAWRACAEACAMATVERFDAGTLLHLGTALETFDLQDVVIDGRIDVPATLQDMLEGRRDSLQIPLDTANRLLCRRYGRPGDSLVNVSACAAGSQAIGQAFQAVRSGRYHRAICGGFDSLIHPLGIGGMQLLGALSTDHVAGATACRPFDLHRCGTVLGEGAAVFVLEDLATARAAGRRILGEIRGFGSSLDAHSPSAPDPDGAGAQRAMRAALADAALPVEAIAHISTHGTGTFLNDAVEALAIRTVFDATWQRTPATAVKGLIGHCIGASGAMELVACLLPLLRAVLPPNPHLRRVGIDCELDHVTAPGRSCTGRWHLKNALGFGGQNACLVMGRADND